MSDTSRLLEPPPARPTTLPAARPTDPAPAAENGKPHAAKPDAPADGGAAAASTPSDGWKAKAVNAAVALLILGGGAAAMRVLVANRTRPAPVEAAVPVPLVRVEPVVLRDAGLDVRTDGVVVPFREIAVSAEVAGRVIFKSDDCRAGRYVTAGAELIRIDPEPYELEVRRLTSEVEQATASVAELEVEVRNTADSIKIAQKDLELAQEQVAREQRMSGRGTGTVTALEQAQRAQISSADRLVTLRNQARLFETRRGRLRQAVELAEANLERVKLDLRRTTVTSPTAGVIVAAPVEQDGYVRAGDPLFTVDDTERAEVRCKLRPREVAWLLAHPPEGTVDGSAGPASSYTLPEIPCRVEYEMSGNRYAWDGVLSRVEGVGYDERTRTLPCIVRVSEPRSVSLASGSPNVPVAAPRALVKGMYVTVAMRTRPAEGLLEIPEEAVRPGNTVFVARDGKLEILELPPASFVDGSILISPAVSPVKPGDRLIVSPLPNVVPGMDVRVEGEDVKRAEGGGRKAEGSPSTDDVT